MALYRFRASRAKVFQKATGTTKGIFRYLCSALLRPAAQQSSLNMTSTPEIIIDKHIPYIYGVFDTVARVQYMEPQEMTAAAVHNADALIVRTRTLCNSSLLAGSRVRIVASATIGVDHIDLTYCREHGIRAVNAPGCNARSVACWVGSVIAAHIAAGRRPGVIGIVGCGHVGGEVLAVARLFGLRALVYDPFIEPREESCSLEQLCRQADIVTFHTPLTDSGPHPTRLMADAALLATLKPDALIINAARGGIADEQALVAHLDAHPRARAAIDCWQGEPHPGAELLSRAFIATPHIAGYSADGKLNGTRAAVTAVAAELGLRPEPIRGLEPVDAVTVAGIEQLPAAILAHYDVRRESLALKQHPEHFESFRTGYPLRRDITYIIEN